MSPFNELKVNLKKKINKLILTIKTTIWFTKWLAK